MTELSPQDIAQLRAAALGKAADFNRILQAVADEFGVSGQQLRGHGRASRLSRARCVLYALAVRKGFTYSDIGRWLGGRDHTTVMSGARKGEAILRGEA